MKRLGILHLTDLHCGSPGSHVTMGDPKDPTVSPSTTVELIYQNAMDGFYSRCESLLYGRRVDLIACTGDLGHQYSNDSLESGAAYTAKLADKLAVKPGNVIVCPGNHDLQRTALSGSEFARFAAVCAEHGFRFSSSSMPVLTRTKGIAVVGLNTCLGGTEQALHSTPKALWDRLRTAVAGVCTNDLVEAIPAALQEQLAAMDIAAVGHTQMERVEKFLLKPRARTVVVFGHHSPLPTQVVDLSPYAQMVDAGVLLLRLIAQGRRVIFLHGHSHSDSALLAQNPDAADPGLLASIGGSGLHGLTTATVTYIQVLVDGEGDLLEAYVHPFRQNGSDYRCDAPYRIKAPTAQGRIPDRDLGKLERNTRYPFTKAAEMLGVPANEALATDLMRLSATPQVEVTGSDQPFVKWNVARLG
jgi:3',5'-cyclic AMP phosphodiesterase CpdA